MSEAAAEPSSPRTTKSIASAYAVFARKDENAFTLGVVNLCFSAWLVGAYPQCFWCYHAVKIPVLLSYKLYLNTMVKKQLFLLDFCYVINYLSVIYYAFCLLKKNVPAMHEANGLNFLGPLVFRCLFGVATGPMAMAIPAFRNSLVLHDWNQVAVLATHWSPNIALWGMRWFPEALNTSFPDTFHIGCEGLPPQHSLFFSKDDCHGTFVEMWLWPVCAYLILWSIPYSLFMFWCGKGMIQRGGYHTMYDDMKDSAFFKGWLNSYGGTHKEMKYMFAHFAACALCMLVSPILWHSFALHTAYLLILFLVAINNGATYYFRVFAKRYYKDKIAIAEKEHAKPVEEQEKGGLAIGSHEGASVGPSPSEGEVEGQVELELGNGEGAQTAPLVEA